VTPMETAEVIQTRWVSGCSRLKSFRLPYSLGDGLVHEVADERGDDHQARMAKSQTMSSAQSSGLAASARARKAMSATPVTP
jgi:hypothetical protein